jgi:hypothetical protein
MTVLSHDEIVQTWSVRAAAVPSWSVARGGVTPTLPHAKTKKTTRTDPDDASPWVATTER